MTYSLITTESLGRNLIQRHRRVAYRGEARAGNVYISQVGEALPADGAQGLRGNMDLLQLGGCPQAQIAVPKGWTP